MAAKADIKRARFTLQQERLRLKDERMTLEREWRQIKEERRAAILALTVLAERYGITDWSEDDPLSDIVRTIAGGLPPPSSKVVRLYAAIPDQAVPEPSRMTAVEGSGRSWRAICRCGWRSSGLSRDSDAAEAALRHEQRLHA